MINLSFSCTPNFLNLMEVEGEQLLEDESESSKLTEFTPIFSPTPFPNILQSPTSQIDLDIIKQGQPLTPSDISLTSEEEEVLLDILSSGMPADFPAIPAIQNPIPRPIAISKGVKNVIGISQPPLSIQLSASTPIKKKTDRAIWIKEQDDLLQSAVAQVGKKWKKIAHDYFTDTKSGVQCNRRYERLESKKNPVRSMPSVTSLPSPLTLKTAARTKTSTNLIATPALIPRTVQLTPYVPSSEVQMTRTFVREQIISIRKARQTDVNAELQRLRKSNVLTASIENKLDQILQKVEIYKQGLDKRGNQDQVKVLLGRALEIKNLCSKTHFIFSHAQATQWAVSSYFIKELSKCFNPQRDVHAFKFLRTPQHQAKFSLQDLKQTLSTKQYTDHNKLIRKELLSVDADLFNYQKNESTINFLSRNYSVLTANEGETAFQAVLESIIKDFIPHIPPKDLSLIAEKGKKLAYSILNKTSGNLFVICIPKEMINNPQTNCQFRSHPYGLPCSCHSEKEDFTILNKLQNHILDSETLCQGNYNPQYRIQAAALTPENSVMTFLLTPFSPREKKILKQVIKKFAMLIFTKYKNN